MKDKICLVTGANEGIGFEVSRGLAAKGAKVVMLCRNEAKGKAAQSEIAKSTGNIPDLMICDLSSQADIRRFGEAFNAAYPRLDVLIHNAGAFFSECRKSSEGIELQFAINHLAPFLLTHLLIGKMKIAGPGARIVVTSSNGHFGGKINFEDHNLEKKYSGLRAYMQSKIGNVLFTFELARRLKDCDITVNCLHPGVVKTSIAQKESKGFARFVWGLLKPFMLSLEKGAATTLYLATSPEAAQFTGKYFVKCKPKTADKSAYDEKLAAKTWELSEKLTGIKEWGVN
jgi:retinol dehydrogenase 12